MNERLLVCISPSPLAEKLIRSAQALAEKLDLQWTAAYVELASKPENDPVKRERIGRLLEMAEELGAKSVTLAGNSAPEAALEYARKNDVVKIVVGKPLKPRWQEIFKGSIVDQFVYAGGTDIIVISGDERPPAGSIPADWIPHPPLGRYLISFMLVAITTILGYAVWERFELANVVMLYLASVVVSAIYLGRGPSLFAATLGALAFDFFLVPPYLTFAINHTYYIFTFLMLLIVSLVISSLTAQVREQAEAALRREAQTSALYELSRDMTSAKNLEHAAEIVITHLARAFGGKAAIFLEDNRGLKLFARSPEYQPDENERAEAQWTFENNQPSGNFSRCYPLRTANGLVGVLNIRPVTESFLAPEQQQILAAFINQVALAIERARLAEQAHRAGLLQATEKLQTALLNSISHDLRTPLVSITGALTSLDEQTETLDAENSRSLIVTAREEAERLNRIVGNLLSMTRIESGAIKLRNEPGDVEDLIGAALEQLGKRLETRKVLVDIPADFPLVPMDFALVAQALVNILENALKYSPPDSAIEVAASRADKTVRLQISDRGVGIPPADLSRVFDKFYRVQRSENVSGTGLGLSISKGIVEAHHGAIYAGTRAGGGTTITIELPL